MEFLTAFIDIVLHLDVHLASLLAAYGVWIYGILFLIIFCESGLVVTPFLPGDSLLFVAGALAATSSGLDIQILMAVLLAAAIIGDNTNYWIGHHIGPRVFRWEQSKFFNRAAFDKTHSFFEHHGRFAVARPAVEHGGGVPVEQSDRPSRCGQGGNGGHNGA